MNDLRSQLAPGWSGVNIALTVVLFFVAWPLALVMIAYIVWGRGLGIDLSRPETLSGFGRRLGRAWQAGKASWSDGDTLSHDGGGAHGGTPAGARDERESLRVERDALERERHAFEAERRAWRERGEREPLDS